MNKIVIVTGGTSGIGYETAKKFLKEGDTVVLASVDSQAVVEQSVSELSKLGEVYFLKCDISNEENCAQVVAQTIEKYGRIDVLANVAGIVGKREPFIESELKDIATVIQVNLMGTINIGYFVGREMAGQESGVIVNVGSICSVMANSENMGYHASKGGVEMVTKAMARELSPLGVRVVSIAPGWVKTAMIDKSIEEVGDKLHMKGRIILPEEIANAIYLVSLPEASAINGTTIFADDGYTSFKGVDV